MVISGGLCGGEQRAAAPRPVPERPGQRADPRDPEQGAQERRRALRDGAYILHPGEHHLELLTHPPLFHLFKT